MKTISTFLQQCNVRLSIDDDERPNEPLGVLYMYTKAMCMMLQAHYVRTYVQSAH